MCRKVLTTCRFNDQILGYHFLAHEGCVIMIFYVPQEPNVVTQNFSIEPTGDKSLEGLLNRQKQNSTHNFKNPFGSIGTTYMYLLRKTRRSYILEFEFKVRPQKSCLHVKSFPKNILVSIF